MFLSPMFIRALWFLARAGLVLFLALALMVLHSYFAGGWAPALILGVFACICWPALLAFAALGAGLSFGWMGALNFRLRESGALRRPRQQDGAQAWS
jgi:hypothetical protein